MNLDWNLHTLNALQSLSKATNVARGDLDLAMLKPAIEPILPYMELNDFPLLQIIAPSQGSGWGIQWNQQTPGETPAEFIAEDGTPTTDAATYALQEVKYKIEIGRGEVLCYAQETAASFMDMVEAEVSAKMRGHWKIMEQQLVRGTESATAPPGFHTLIPDSQIYANTDASGGAFFDQMKLIEAITEVEANPNTGFIVSSSRAWLQAVSIAIAERNADVVVGGTDIPGGARVPTYQGVKWTTTKSVLNTMTFDGTQTTALTGGSNTEIFVGNTRHIKRKFLTAPAFIPLSGDEDMKKKFSIKSTWAAGITNFLYWARIPGVNVTNISQ